MIEQIKEFLHNYRRHFWHSFYYWLTDSSCKYCPYFMKVGEKNSDWDCVNYTRLNGVLK